MNKALAFALAGTAIACSIATAANPTPRDVSRFIVNADNCEHLAGEFDNSLAQSEQRRIERDVARYCEAARKQLSTLRKKYRGNADIERVLSEHANDTVTASSK